MEKFENYFMVLEFHKLEYHKIFLEFFKELEFLELEF